MKRLTLLILMLGGTVLWGTAVFTAGQQPAQAYPGTEPFLPPISQNLELVDHLGGSVLTIAAQEPWVYTTFGSRLAVFDASDSTNPQMVGQLMLATDVIQVMVILGDELYLTGGDGYLHIVNVSNPASPYLVRQFQIEETSPAYQVKIRALAAAGNYVYVAYWEGINEWPSRIAVIDVTDPVKPVLISRLNLPGLDLLSNSNDILAVDGAYLYVAVSTFSYDSLQIIDIKDPALPTVIGTYTDEDVFDIGALAVAGDYAILSDGSRLDIIDVSQPTTPFEVGSLSYLYSSFTVLDVKNDYLFLLDSEGQPHILDFQNPLLPGQNFSTALPYTGSHIAITDNHIYLATGDYCCQPAGFQILQSDLPQIPTLIGSYEQVPFSFLTNHIAVVDDQLYVSDLYRTEYRLPINNLSSPEMLPTYQFLPVLVRDDIAFNPRLSIYDVSNPQFPTWIGYTNTSGGHVVDVVGDYAFVGSTVGPMGLDGAFRVIDISDYANPVEISRYPFAWGVEDLFVTLNYAYVLTDSLSIFDVSDPEMPVLAATYNVGAGKVMAPYEQYALVLTDDRLLVLDLADPIAPVMVGDYELAFGGTQGDKEIAVHDHWAFVSVSSGWLDVGSGGLEVWDLSDMQQLTLAGWYVGDISNVAFYEDEIYGVGRGGLFHLRWLADEITAVLPSTGGNFTTTDGKTTFSFGNETLTDTMQVDYRALNRPNNQGSLWGMDRFFEVTAVYSTTHQPITTVANPYTITLSYTDTSAASEESLALYFWDGTQWLMEPSSMLNISQQTVTATPTRLGRFALLGETNQVHLPTVWHNGNLDDTRLVLGLNELAGASQFGDGSGYDHHGQCMGADCPMAGVVGVRGTAVQFDGLNDVISLGDPRELRAIRQEITLAAWVKPANDEGIQNILAHGYSLQPQGETFLRIDNGRYEIGSWDGTDHLASFAIPPTDIGQWVHLVGVYDGTTWRLYRNGVEVSMATDETGAVFVYEDWAVGANGSGDGRFFQGIIDEVVIYNRGLSAAEVTNLHESYLSQ